MLVGEIAKLECNCKRGGKPSYWLKMQRLDKVLPRWGISPARMVRPRTEHLIEQPFGDRLFALPFQSRHRSPYHPKKTNHPVSALRLGSCYCSKIWRELWREAILVFSSGFLGFR